MDDLTIRLEFLEALVRELVSADVITEGMIDRVREDFAARARLHEGTPRGEKFEQLAHMATVLPFEATAPSPSQFVAEQRRARMRLVPDGGKSQD